MTRGRGSLIYPKRLMRASRKIELKAFAIAAISLEMSFIVLFRESRKKCLGPCPE